MSIEKCFSRRAFLTGSAGLSGLLVAGCQSTNTTTGKTFTSIMDRAGLSSNNSYGPMPQERYPIPAVDLSQIPSKYYRTRIDYPTIEPAGTVIVDTSNFYLYHVEKNGKAMRYGVGLGRAGFEWSGRARIAWKRKWPKWTPPAEMIARDPALEKYSIENGGMSPGLDNPLGARALYIFEGNVDTLYRLHGTGEFASIGKAVSSGCVRLLNQDVIHLYDRVRDGSPIVVT